MYNKIRTNSVIFFPLLLCLYLQTFASQHFLFNLFLVMWIFRHMSFSWSALRCHDVIRTLVTGDKWLVHSYSFCACPPMFIGSAFFKSVSLYSFQIGSSCASYLFHFYQDLGMLDCGNVNKRMSLKTSFSSLLSI